MCYEEPGAFAAVEIKVKDFIQLPGGQEAIEKELNEMRRRRFNDDEDIPEYLKWSALECRIICTTKRDGTMKARLVAKTWYPRERCLPSNHMLLCHLHMV